MSAILRNCIVCYNQGGNYFNCEFEYSCTTPLPVGPGNFTDEPLFVDLVANNLHLQSLSPCINAGRNFHAPPGPDLNGNPRIIGGTVDVGAYEFQSPQSLLAYAWLRQFGLPTEGSADTLDSDGDHLTNYQEWRAAPIRPAL